MSYLELDITIKGDQAQGRDIAIAELNNVGFESYVETERGVLAYIPLTDYNEKLIETLIVFISPLFKGSSYSSKVIEEKNWNKEWEANFEPVEVEDFCYIRSNFHNPSGNHKYEIIIEPKMSFGTGHHSTTWLMIEMLKNKDLNGKTILDMGCGTAVLAILASKMGGEKVIGIDIDKWAYNNSLENLDVNNISNTRIIYGNASNIPPDNYDVILANITRNILIEDIPKYAKHSPEGGLLILSGFYMEDIEIIKTRATEFNFNFLESKTKNNWASVVFKHKV